MYLPPLIAPVDAWADGQDQEDESQNEADERGESLGEGLLHVVHVAVKSAVEEKEAEWP